MNMKNIKKGDIVSRTSYNNDIFFKVKRIIKLVNSKEIAILKGIGIRIEADAPIEDLNIVSKEDQLKREKEIEDKINSNIGKGYNQNRGKEIVYTGKILHLDGDKRYSEKSLMYYQKVGLNAIVKNIPEYKQPKVIYRLLQIYNPDILVITRA